MNKRDPAAAAPVSGILPYVLGTFGLQAVIGFAATFQAEFYNKMYAGLDAGVLAGSAFVLFASKLISSVLDPVIGVRIDQKGRSGETLFRYVRRGILPLACMTLLLFFYIPFDRLGGRWAMYGYITLTSVLWNIAMSLVEIPTQSMISFLAKTEAGSERLTADTNIAKSLGLGAPAFLVTLIMLLTDLIRGAGNTAPAAYYLINAVAVTLLGVLCMAPLAASKPKDTVRLTEKPPESVSIGAQLNDLRRDRNVRVVFLINLLGFARNMSNFILLQANGALIGRVSLFGRSFDTTMDMTWLPYIFGNVSSVAALFVIPRINSRFKEKKTYVVFSVLDFVFSMAAYGFYVSQAASGSLRGGNGALYMIMTFSFIGSFLMGVNQYIPLSMTAQIARGEKERRGSEYESAPYAVLTMSVKLANALSTVFGLWIVGRCGYNELVYQAGTVTPRIQNTVMFAFMAIPGISTLLSAVPALFYRAPAPPNVPPPAVCAEGASDPGRE